MHALLYFSWLCCIFNCLCKSKKYLNSIPWRIKKILENNIFTLEIPLLIAIVLRWYVFYVFYQTVFFSTFLCSQPHFLLIRWRVSDISRYSPPYSFLGSLFPSRLPSCPSFKRAFVELLMERFRALPCLSEAFSLSFIFPCCSGLPIATSWSQFFTIERFPRATQHIRWRKYLAGMITIIMPK